VASLRAEQTGLAMGGHRLGLPGIGETGQIAMG
jgi:hypothetical protein